MSRLNCVCGCVILMTMMLSGIVRADEQLTERETALAAQLSGTLFEGMFTVVGKESPAKPERYEIVSATKAENSENLWILLARIKYGDQDVTVPLSVPIDWAGDTPMISLTDWTVPPLGTFSARVLIHGDRYAGTWQHGKVGGHLYGTITKLPAGDKPAESGSAE